MLEERVSVLVVAGDARLRRTICATLGPTGFTFEEAHSCPEAIANAIRHPYSLVLIGLGEESSVGFDTCRCLRSASRDMRIVLIRSKRAPEDEVRALEAGADDCVSMPLRYRELVGRLLAVLRRPTAGPSAEGTILRGGEVKIDITRRVCWRGRNEVHLSPREFDLLAVLMKHKARALTHVRLLTAAWGPEVRHDVDYLRSYIKALRTKIEPNPGTPEYILTVPWVGYMFCDPSQDRSAAERPHLID
jgi:two-component system KDP operon response regulator KdpE